MLILSRQVGETVVIDSDVRVTVEKIRGGRVKLSFDAPKHVAIDREEVVRSKHNPEGGKRRV